MKFGIWQGLLMISYVYWVCIFLEMLINEEHETENSKKKRKMEIHQIKALLLFKKNFSGDMANVVRKSHVWIIVNYMDE